MSVSKYLLGSYLCKQDWHLLMYVPLTESRGKIFFKNFVPLQSALICFFAYFVGVSKVN